MTQPNDKEPFISADLRPTVVPQLESTPPIDPDGSPEDLRAQALSLLGITERAWEALHPEFSHRDFWKCRFHRSPELTWNTLDGETVVLHTETSRYYTLNAIGTMIWDYYCGERTLSAVLDAICEDYEVDRGRAQRDLLSFTGRLLSSDLIREIN
jgi:hypothetical protein